MTNNTTEVIHEDTAIELAVVMGPESGLVTISPDGNKLTLADDISFDQYRQVLRVLKNAGQKYKLWLADTISQGESKFGQTKVHDVLEQLEFEMPDVRAAIAIASVPDELRIDGINADHLIELSKLDRKGQLKWGRIASEKGLTSTQLRLSIVEGSIVDKAAARLLNSGVVTIHGIRQSFDVWALRIGGVSGVLKLDPDVQRDISEELQAISEFALDLDAKIEEQVNA